MIYKRFLQYVFIGSFKCSDITRMSCFIHDIDDLYHLCLSLWPRGRYIYRSCQRPSSDLLRSFKTALAVIFYFLPSYSNLYGSFLLFVFIVGFLVSFCFVVKTGLSACWVRALPLSGTGDLSPKCTVQEVRAAARDSSSFLMYPRREWRFLSTLLTVCHESEMPQFPVVHCAPYFLLPVFAHWAI